MPRDERSQLAELDRVVVVVDEAGRRLINLAQFAVGAQNGWLAILFFVAPLEKHDGYDQDMMANKQKENTVSVFKSLPDLVQSRAFCTRANETPCVLQQRDGDEVLSLHDKHCT